MANSLLVTRASSTNKLSVAERFAGETPAQIAQHEDIARRHRPRRNANDAALLVNLRVKELQRIYADKYGAGCLPDDDAGHADLRLMADHLAQIDSSRIRLWAATWMPTLTTADLEAIITEVGTGRRWKADALALELGLDDATRTRLKIKTIGAIDCRKAQRTKRRRAKRVTAARARRAKAGAKPREQSAAATKPWLKEGISKSTYYRRRATQKLGLETLETNSRPIDRRSSIEKDQCHEAPSGTTDLEQGHGGETKALIAKPLTLPCFRVRKPCDQKRLDPIAGLEPVSVQSASGKQRSSPVAPVERARRHLHAVATAVAQSPNPELWSYLLVAASAAWARAKAGADG